MSLLDKVKDFFGKEKIEEKKEEKPKTEFTFPAEYGKYVGKDSGIPMIHPPRRVYTYSFRGDDFYQEYSSSWVGVERSDKEVKVYVKFSERTYDVGAEISKEIEEWGKSVKRAIEKEKQKKELESKINTKNVFPAFKMEKADKKPTLSINTDKEKLKELSQKVLESR